MTLSPAVAAAAKEASERLGVEWGPARPTWADLIEVEGDAFGWRFSWIERFEGAPEFRGPGFALNADQHLACLHGYTLLAAALAEKGVAG